MSDKLKDYQVLDVSCGGAFYKVKHKVTNNIFTWKALNCSTLSDKQIENISNDVKNISKVQSENVLRYHDTILHAPSKTLYFVMEHNSWQSISELMEMCKATDKYLAESFIWYLLHALARVCKAFEDLSLAVLKKCVKAESIFVGDSGELKIDCFDLPSLTKENNMIRQIGDIIHTLCYRLDVCERKNMMHYSDDLNDVVTFLIDDKNTNLRPDVVLYHPTVLANLESLSGPKNLSEILVSYNWAPVASEANKCDSEKAVELSKVIEPAPRIIVDSPIYTNMTIKRDSIIEIEESDSIHECMSPTLAALALELPGFVPRSRRPYSGAVTSYNCAQKISKDTFSNQWMSRLVALRQREESLNKRERDLIAKEIVNSPAVKFIPLKDPEVNVGCDSEGSNGITLPHVLAKVQDERVTSRRRRRSGSVKRARRKTYNYEELDSSLSADAGDGSIIVTSTKFTKENMPRRNIFPETSNKKVHFTPANPFVESDESVTLTFYDLENVDAEGYQVPKMEEKTLKDITKFKYLDVEKVALEKRAARNQCTSSPSKQVKLSKPVFGDITNHSSIRKTPSKTSLASKGSNPSRFTMYSGGSQWSESGHSTRSSVRHSLAVVTPPPEIKKTKSRKSLLPFKTPFKFKTSTKV